MVLSQALLKQTLPAIHLGPRPDVEAMCSTGTWRAHTLSTNLVRRRCCTLRERTRLLKTMAKSRNRFFVQAVMMKSTQFELEVGSVGAHPALTVSVYTESGRGHYSSSPALIHCGHPSLEVFLTLWCALEVFTHTERPLFMTLQSATAGGLWCSPSGSSLSSIFILLV